ncbi:hypothetical protein ADUPG1_013369 [Aduncisulcus paluster]|uniref:Uncharacterized protein n=1 Tax=Aduncisulcus paluster TaxID=2918883 RepID=A0ABQ5K4I5_9EUKA|nr:hypothetical protein ADUPG1_013369 [Aduncisulcus paluster]
MDSDDSVPSLSRPILSSRPLFKRSTQFIRPSSPLIPSYKNSYHINSRPHVELTSPSRSGYSSSNSVFQAPYCLQSHFSIARAGSAKPQRPSRSQITRDGKVPSHPSVTRSIRNRSSSIPKQWSKPQSHISRGVNSRSISQSTARSVHPLEGYPRDSQLLDSYPHIRQQSHSPSIQSPSTKRPDFPLSPTVRSQSHSGQYQSTHYRHGEPFIKDRYSDEAYRASSSTKSSHLQKPPLHVTMSRRPYAHFLNPSSKSKKSTKKGHKQSSSHHHSSYSSTSPSSQPSSPMISQEMSEETFQGSKYRDEMDIEKYHSEYASLQRSPDSQPSHPMRSHHTSKIIQFEKEGDRHWGGKIYSAAPGPSIDMGPISHRIPSQSQNMMQYPNVNYHNIQHLSEQKCQEEEELSDQDRGQSFSTTDSIESSVGSNSGSSVSTSTSITAYSSTSHSVREKHVIQPSQPLQRPGTIPLSPPHLIRDPHVHLLRKEEQEVMKAQEREAILLGAKAQALKEKEEFLKRMMLTLERQSSINTQAQTQTQTQTQTQVQQKAQVQQKDQPKDKEQKDYKDTRHDAYSGMKRSIESGNQSENKYLTGSLSESKRDQVKKDLQKVGEQAKKERERLATGKTRRESSSSSPSVTPLQPEKVQGSSILDNEGENDSISGTIEKQSKRSDQAESRLGKFTRVAKKLERVQTLQESLSKQAPVIPPNVMNRHTKVDMSVNVSRLLMPSRKIPDSSPGSFDEEQRRKTGITPLSPLILFPRDLSNQQIPLDSKPRVGREVSVERKELIQSDTQNQSTSGTHKRYKGHKEGGRTKKEDSPAIEDKPRSKVSLRKKISSPTHRNPITVKKESKYDPDSPVRHDIPLRGSSLVVEEEDDDQLGSGFFE